MLKRWITAIVIILIVIPVVYISPLSWRIFALILIVFGVTEFLNLPRTKKYSLFSKIIIYLVAVAPAVFINSFASINGAYVSMLLIILCLLVIIDKNIDFRELSLIVTFCAFVVVSSCSSIYIRDLDNGFYVLIFVFFVTAMADTGAFFIGSKYGKHKLIPRLSPKKSVEGLVGAIAFAIVFGVLYWLFLPINIGSIWLVILICIILGFSATFGDLFFSSIKRSFNVKDFANFLPGHGGIMDRVDSHLMSLIVYFIIIGLFNWS